MTLNPTPADPMPSPLPKAVPAPPTEPSDEAQAAAFDRALGSPEPAVLEGSIEEGDGGTLVRAPDTASPPWSAMTKAIVTVAALVLLGLVIWRFNLLLRPLILAAVIAYLLNPLVNFVTRRTRLQRGTAVAIIYVGFILIVLALLVGVGFVAVDQTDRLLTALPSLIERTVAWFDSQLDRTFELGPFAFTPAEQIGDVSASGAVSQGLAWLQENLLRGGTVAAGVFSATVSLLSTFFVVMFIAIYLSRDTALLWRKVGETANAPGYQRDAERLSRDFVRIWNAYLRGQVFLGFAMFVVVSITLTVLGVNFSLALGGLAGLLEFLPIIGPTLSTAAAVLVAIFQDGNWLGLSPFWYAVVVLVAMVALQQIEQAVLVPRFVGGALDLHPVVVIVVVLMGTSLAGILGAVLAAPVAATFKLLGGYAWRKMFDLPPFPEPEPLDEPPSRAGLPARLRALFLRTNYFDAKTQQTTLTQRRKGAKNSNSKEQQRQEKQYTEEHR